MKARIKPIRISFLRQLRVIDEGKISAWGMIRAIFKGIPEEEAAVKELWSSRFLKYGRGGFKAEPYPKGVKIINRKGLVVTTIAHNRIFIVESSEVVVGIDGYLFYIYEAPRNREDSSYFSYLKSFRQVRKGEKPITLDNSPFVKVSKRLIGRKLIEINLDFDKAYRIFTKRGRPIRHQIRYPLSYARWEPESEFAKYGKK